MKTRYVATSLLLAGLIGLVATPARASDELAGVLIGAGAGAAVGHAVGGRDAAIVGGVIGAMVGAAVADDDDRRYRARARTQVVYGQPRVYYAEPPCWPAPRPAYPQWRYERDNRWDRDGRHDGHHGRDDWRRDGRDDGRRDWRDDGRPRWDR